MSRLSFTSDFVREEHARASGEAWSRALSSTDEEKRETLRGLLRSGRNSRARVKISTQEKEVFLDRARIV